MSGYSKKGKWILHAFRKSNGQQGKRLEKLVTRIINYGIVRKIKIGIEWELL